MLTRKGKLVAAILTVLLALLLIVAASGCTKLIELDRQIWSPPTMTEAERERGQPPPLLELIASTLAFVGFTGFAIWIRRVKKAACTKADVETIVKNNNAPA